MYGNSAVDVSNVRRLVKKLHGATVITGRPSGFRSTSGTENLHEDEFVLENRRSTL